MPPKQSFTPRKWFIAYSEEALNQVLGYTKVNARKEAVRIWNVLQRRKPHNFGRLVNNCIDKKDHEDDIKQRKQTLARWAEAYRSWVAIPVGDRTAEQWKSLVQHWEGCYNTQRGIVDVYVLLRRSTRELTRALQIIYQDQRMRNYALQKQQDVANSETQAQQELQDIADEEDQMGIPTTTRNEIKIPQDWLPGFKKQEAKVQVKTDYLNAHRNVTPGWHGCWPVTEPGGHSRAAVYVKVDAHGRIRDRLLRKETDEPRECWGDLTRWEHSSDGLRNVRNQIVPMEVACNRDLSAITSTRFGQAVDVVRLRRFTIDIDRLKYNIYFHYCGYGDLSALIDRYNGTTIHYRRPPTADIPEPFLWRVFLSLAVAGLAMENGTTTDQKDKDWTKEIVHRDLKPSNVFLDVPTRGHFETYPTVRLGDFGISIKTHEQDLLNPTIFLQFYGTLPFAAPEQIAYADLQDCEPVHRYKQLSWTNVYSIGIIMLSLITLVPVPEIEYAWGDMIAAHVLREEPYGVNNKPYSVDLIDLVQECLDLRPLSRIEFKDIVARIEAAISTFDADNGRKDAPYTDPTLSVQDDLVRTTDDYARALSLQQMPAPRDL